METFPQDSVYFEICMYIVHVVSIYIRREAEKINMLALSVLKLRIIASRQKGYWSWTLIRKLHLTLQVPRFIKHHLLQCQGSNKSRNQTQASDRKWQNSKCQKVFILSFSSSTPRKSERRNQKLRK